MQGAGEGADLAAIGAMGGNADLKQHAQKNGLVAAGGLAHCKLMALKGQESGGERGVAVGNRQGPAADEVIERHTVLGDVEAQHSLDWSGKMGHNQGPALDCLRARRATGGPFKSTSVQSRGDGCP